MKPTPMRTRSALRLLSLTALVGAAAWGLPALHALAQPAPTARVLFADADLALGERLVAEHQCAECHARKFGGDGSQIYRPGGRISTPGFLRGMVEQCNTQLNFGLFPEEVTAIAAVINRDHYRFE